MTDDDIEKARNEHLGRRDELHSTIATIEGLLKEAGDHMQTLGRALSSDPPVFGCQSARTSTSFPKALWSS